MDTSSLTRNAVARTLPIAYANSPQLPRAVCIPADILEGMLRASFPAPRCPAVADAPPHALADVHDPWMVMRFWERIEHALAEPVVVDLSLGYRRVSVMGLAVFDCLPDGSVITSRWMQFPDAPPTREFGYEADYVLDGTPHAWTWLDMFKQDFALTHEWKFDVASSIREAYVAWLFCRFKAYIRRHVDMRVVRATVREALALDPWMRSIAHRLYRPSGPAEMSTSYAAYNLVVRHRAAFESLDREAPHLVALFGMLVEAPNFPSSGEPTARLKAYLVGTHGLSQRTWRVLANGGRRLLAEFLPFYRTASVAATIDLLRVLEALGCRDAPPRWLLWSFLTYFGDPGARFVSVARQPELSSPAWRRLAHLAQTGDADTCHSIRLNLVTVLAWLADEVTDVDPRTFRSAPWSWFLRRTDAWKTSQARARLARLSWPAPFASARFGKFTIVPLTDGKAMQDEALVMENCIDTYIEACAKGRALFFSVRFDGADLPHAHILFRREDTEWTFERAAGFRNARPSPKAEVVAKLIKFRMRCLERALSEVPTASVEEQGMPQAQRRSEGAGPFHSERA